MARADPGSPVTPDYRPPFRFTGALHAGLAVPALGQGAAHLMRCSAARGQGVVIFLR